MLIDKCQHYNRFHHYNNIILDIANIYETLIINKQDIYIPKQLENRDSARGTASRTRQVIPTSNKRILVTESMEFNR